jgi:hypothetical protein
LASWESTGDRYASAVDAMKRKHMYVRNTYIALSTSSILLLSG